MNEKKTIEENNIGAGGTDESDMKDIGNRRRKRTQEKTGRNE